MTNALSLADDTHARCSACKYFAARAITVHPTTMDESGAFMIGEAQDGTRQVCVRFPTEVEKNPGDYCGEWSKLAND